MAAEPDALDTLTTYLRTGQPPPFPWIVAHARDGDLAAAAGRLYARSEFAFPAFAHHAAVPVPVYARGAAAALLAWKPEPRPSPGRQYLQTALRRWTSDQPSHSELQRRARDVPPLGPRDEPWARAAHRLFAACAEHDEVRARAHLSYCVEACLPDARVAAAFRNEVPAQLVVVRMRAWLARPLTGL